MKLLEKLGTLRSVRLSALLVAALLAACATGGKIQRLSEGMSEESVVEVMGRPDGLMTAGDFKALKWANRLMSDWSMDRADYWVIFNKGLVVGYGPGEVRQNGPSVLILVPLGN